MKILFITDGLAPFELGGMQRHSTNLLKGLLNQGHTLTVCMPYPTVEKDEFNWFVQLGIPQEQKEKVVFILVKWPQLIWFPGHYLMSNWLYSRSVTQKIQHGYWDVAISKGFTGWCLVGNPKRDYPLAVKFHGYEMFQDMNTEYDSIKLLMLRWAVKRVQKRADAVFTYSKQITDLCIDHNLIQDQQVFEIPGGVDKSMIRNVITSNSNQALNFVFVGRFERRKGLKELNEAVNEYQGDSNFHFVGPIPIENRILNESCVYYGEIKTVNDLTIILDKMDVMIVPSHSEGMPNTIMEGMARGLAIIATKVGAVPLLVNEDNGWLIEPNETSQLLKSIIAADLSVLDQKKLNSLKKIKEFDWEQIEKRYTSSLNQMVMKHQGQNN